MAYVIKTPVHYECPNHPDNEPSEHYGLDVEFSQDNTATLLWSVGEKTVLLISDIDGRFGELRAPIVGPLKRLLDDFVEACGESDWHEREFGVELAANRLVTYCTENELPEAVEE